MSHLYSTALLSYSRRGHLQNEMRIDVLISVIRYIELTEEYLVFSMRNPKYLRNPSFPFITILDGENSFIQYNPKASSQELSKITIN